MLYSSLLFMSLFTQFTFTRFITIQNNGFEADLVDYKYGTNSYDYGPIQNWDQYDPNNVMEAWTDGIINPKDGTSFNDSLFGDSAPEGTLIIYLNPDGNKNAGVFGVHQTLLHTITANTTYTLTVWIGNPATNTWAKDSKWTGEYENTGFEPYAVQLVAAASDTVLAQDNNSLSIPDGEWRQSRVILNVSDGNPHIGEEFNIRLLWSTNVITKLSIYWDDVRLEAVTKNRTESPTNQLITTTEAQTSQPTSYPTVGPTNQPIVTTNHPTAISVPPTNNPVTMTPTMSSFSPSTTSTTETNHHTSSVVVSSTDHPTIRYYDREITEVRETTTDNERSDSIEFTSKPVDWLAIILVSISGVVCCVIMVIGVCFIYERNKQMKEAQDVDDDSLPGPLIEDTNTVGMMEMKSGTNDMEIIYNNDNNNVMKEETNNNNNNGKKTNDGEDVEDTDTGSDSDGLWDLGGSESDHEAETKGANNQEPGLHYSTKGMQ